MKKKLVCGIGINDANYPVQPSINGRQIVCVYYQTWKDILNRCYSEKRLKISPTYRGCEISEHWKTFSNFKTWMETQNWIGKQLDKDILFPNNKIYSEHTCVFVDQSINSFLTDSSSARGKYMIGVSWHKRVEKYIARCNDGAGDVIFLGYFNDELSAHLAWKACKHKLACELADEQTDTRVAEALRSRFAPETNLENK